MPNVDDNIRVVKYPVPIKGVNINANIVELDSLECLNMKNLIVRNGIVSRYGSSKFETDEVVASKAITGLHRFYYSTSSKQTLAAADTVVKYHDGATWQNARTGMTTGNQVHFATWLDKAYIANTADQPSSWSGTTNANVAAAPADTKQFLPYQDRLLSITGGDLTWSASFSDATWETVANCGVRPDTQLYGMIHHSVSNSDQGYEAGVLLGGANGMYLFKGRDLRIPATTGDYSIYTLATKVGCNAPRTMVWTPRGSMYLGSDRQVYLLPFDSAIPIPVGTKIHSSDTAVEGIESIPSGQIEGACAVYHDGFYKLSVAPSGSTTNTRQWWLDVDRLHKDENRLVGPWYGPMEGNAVSCFIVQSGAGDVGELLGGESDATTGGFVYNLNTPGVHQDVDTDISLEYKSFYNPLTSEEFNKTIHHMEFDIRDTEQTPILDFIDIEGVVDSGNLIEVSGTVITWDDQNWGTFNWSGKTPKRIKANISNAVQLRRASVRIKSTTSTDSFELYAIKVKVQEESKIFDRKV